MRVREGDRLFRSRTFRFAVLANLVLGIGVPFWSYLHYPGWMWGYTRDPKSVPMEQVALIFGVLYWIPFLIGFAMPRWMHQRGHSGWWAILGGVLAQGALILWQLPAYTVVQQPDGSKVPLAEVQFLSNIGMAGAAVAVVLLFLAKPVVKKG